MLKYLIPIIVLLCLAGCKKVSYNNPQDVYALNVINAAPDFPSINVNFNQSPLPYYLFQNALSYGAAFETGGRPGKIPVIIYTSTDTANIFYSGAIDVEAQHTYSMYVINSSSKDGVVFMQDSIPYYTDSTAGIRFINLLSESGPLTVNLSGNDPSQTEFGAITFKQITAFKPYNASVIGGSYTFEIRDAALADPLAIFTWNYTFGKNYTVVVSGSAAAGINAFQVNNF